MHFLSDCPIVLHISKSTCCVHMNFVLYVFLVWKAHVSVLCYVTWSCWMFSCLTKKILPVSSYQCDFCCQRFVPSADYTAALHSLTPSLEHSGCDCSSGHGPWLQVEISKVIFFFLPTVPELVDQSTAEFLQGRVLAVRESLCVAECSLWSKQMIKKQSRVLVSKTRMNALMHQRGLPGRPQP